MGDLEAKVWRRYGNGRIYVSRGDETVGWYDLRTGRHELQVPGLAAPFWETVHAECRRLGEPAPQYLAPTNPAGPANPANPAVPAGPAKPANRAVPANPVEPAGPISDLGLTEAGAAARARAVELRTWRTRLAFLVGVRTQAANFAIGAKGERFVGGKLDKWARRKGWHVLHAVPVGRNGADIDHVLIGPFGVVTINTKTTRCKVWVAEHGMMVGGTKVNYLRNSRFEAKRTRRLLAAACGRHVPVQSVIVFVGAKGFTVKNGGPRDIAVLSDVKALRRWLRRRGRTLTPEQVAAVHAAARQPATWRPPAR
ncbi:hypothetical protein GCM10022254_63910 [Actinomadura meridiana]|uniref:NERD domain-containing protein n=1 Tax=Actinomadura meridiana TaxID=559626 RepID=A0ABP8CJP7_9ACTN